MKLGLGIASKSDGKAYSPKIKGNVTRVVYRNNTEAR